MIEARRAGGTDRPALRRCAAVEPDEFAAGYWASRPLLSRAADLPSGFDDLFSLAAVDELLSRRGLRTPFLRVAKDGKVVESSRFTRSGGAGAEVADQIADDRVLDLFASGHTLVLQALHRTWPAIIDFANQLTAELGHPVQVNAYITPPQNTGFSAHYDVHDVFVLQVAGEKRWVVHEPVHPAPLRDQIWTQHRAAVAARAEEEPVLAEVLRPGDSLYLPRGFLHAAEALGDVSAHLTIGIHPVTRYALVETLTALAAEVPELRGSLPLGVDATDPGQLTEDLAATAEALAGWLRRADPAAVAERLRRRQTEAVPPAPIAPLAQAAVAAAADADTVVRLRGGVTYRLASTGDHVIIEWSGRRLSLPPNTEPAVKAMLAGEPLAVADLPGLDAADQRTLARRLLREAIVVPVRE
jgi:lysine-specific demethylase/histidyl-hydroxylase NO66